MTKKDYIVLAQFMRDMRPVGGTARAEIHWHAGLVALTEILSRDNPAFDAVRFRKACEQSPTIIVQKTEGEV